MDYWTETMQDDCYFIASECWRAETYRVVETVNKGRERDKGLVCDVSARRPSSSPGTSLRNRLPLTSLIVALDSVTARLTEFGGRTR